MTGLPEDAPSRAGRAIVPLFVVLVVLATSAALILTTTESPELAKPPLTGADAALQPATANVDPKSPPPLSDNPVPRALPRLAFDQPSRTEAALDTEIGLALAAIYAWGPTAESDFRLALARLNADTHRIGTRLAARIRDQDPLSGDLVGLVFLAGELRAADVVPALEDLILSPPPPKTPGNGFSARDRHDQNLGMSLLALEKIAAAKEESQEITRFLLQLLEQPDASPNSVATAARILRRQGIDLEDVAAHIQATSGAARAELLRLEIIELVPGQSPPAHVSHTGSE